MHQHRIRCAGDVTQVSRGWSRKKFTAQKPCLVFKGCRQLLASASLHASNQRGHLRQLTRNMNFDSGPFGHSFEIIKYNNKFFFSNRNFEKKFKNCFENFFFFNYCINKIFQIVWNNGLNLEFFDKKYFNSNDQNYDNYDKIDDFNQNWISFVLKFFFNLIILAKIFWLGLIDFADCWLCFNWLIIFNAFNSCIILCKSDWFLAKSFVFSTQWKAFSRFSRIWFQTWGG